MHHRRRPYDQPARALAAFLHGRDFGDRGIEPARLLVDSFILMDPRCTLRLGAVPFWMKFKTESSADALERYLDEAEPYDEIRLMLFAHGVDSIGLTPIGRWRALLDRARPQGRLVGVDEHAYPADFATFARYHRALRAIPRRCPLPPALGWDQLERVLCRNDVAARAGVAIRDVAPA